MPRKNLDHQLHIIRDELLYLSSMVETVLVDSVIALKDHDVQRSRFIQKNAKLISTKRFALENQIIVTIALEAPILHDLRFLASALNICTELERIGDYAKTIASINMTIEGVHTQRHLNIACEMGIKVSEMLHHAMTAFIHANVSSAVLIISDDDIIDTLYTELFSGLMNFVASSMGNTELANQLLWVAHNLERAGDRVTNICERTIYVETGEFQDMIPAL